MIPATGERGLAALIRALHQIVGARNVHSSPAVLASYGYDAYFRRCTPLLVVAPQTTQQVSETVKALGRAGVAFVARGSGTGYAGGSVPNPVEVVVLLTGLNRIRTLDVKRRFIVAEAGVQTGFIQSLVLRHGLRYPPDPSSRAVSTIGGNVATNAGGPHCLGYGVTSNYVLEVECVDSDGEIFCLGGDTALTRGLDLRGAVVGSEGTTVIITAVKLRLIPAPRAVSTIYASFESPAAAFPAINGLFECGLMPIALDMTASVFDPRGRTLPFPNDTTLYIEVDGEIESTAIETERIREALAQFPCEFSTHSKADLAKKRFEITQRRWRGITRDLKLPAYFLFDAVVRRTDLAQIFDVIAQEARAFDFVVANTFHAGDGNIHPTPFYDAREPNIRERLEAFRDNILDHVCALGGTLSGEHGLGLEKRHLVSEFYSAPAQRTQQAVLSAFRGSGALGRGKLLPDQIVNPSKARTDWLGTPRIDPVNGYAIVPATQTLAELRADLEGTPSQFTYEPVDRSPDAALGDLILAGAPAVRERRFGPGRDLLLGGLLTTRLGVEAEFGSVFAKDVSGLDIRKLVFGSAGRIGSLKTLVLKLAPRDQLCLVGKLPVADLNAGRRLLAEVDRIGGRHSSRFLVREEDESWKAGFILDGHQTEVENTAVRLLKRLTDRGLHLQAWSFDGLDLFDAPPSVPMHWSEATLGGLDADACAGPLIAFDYPDYVGRFAFPTAETPRSQPIEAIEAALVEAFCAL